MFISGQADRLDLAVLGRLVRRRHSACLLSERLSVSDRRAGCPRAVRCPRARCNAKRSEVGPKFRGLGDPRRMSRIGWKAHVQAQTVPPDHVFLLTEHGCQFLTGSLYVALADHLDG